MKKKIFTLFLTLVMMISIANPVLAAETSKEQIPEKVQWLINKGWVKGRGNGLDLDKTITRAEVAKMAALISNYEKEADNVKGTQGSFTDVNVEHWANGYINVATTKGYVNGYPDKTFKPENPITNAEIITILSKLHPEWKTSLTEGKIWPTAEVNFAKTNNILKDIKNLDGKNDKNSTRQDVFEMIYNLCQEKIRLTVKNAEKQLSVKESTKPSAINWWWNNGYLANREYAVRFYDINKAQLYTKYVYEGDRVSSINAPEVDGYKFEGWMDRDTGKYFEFNDRVYRDIDLIAKYSTDMAKIKPAEPKPVEPKPAEPKPVEPKPVEPKPVEPKPVEPKPVEPKPVEPKPVEPKPVEPKPVEPKPVEPKPVEPKPVEPKPVEPKPGELDKQIEAEANAQLKETIEKAKNALEENKNEPAKAAEELKKAIAKAEKILSEGSVEAKKAERTTLNDARIKYLNAVAELNKQIEAEASAQLKETIEKAKNALEENKNEPAKAAEELKTAIAKAEKVLSEGNVEAKTNETTTLNDARRKYLDIATETEKLNKLLEESLPLYQDKNVSDEFTNAYKEANKVSVNGESLEEVKEAISKLEKAIAKEKELNKQIEAEASAQLKETIEKAKKTLEENKNEPQKAAEELKKAIEKAEKVLSEGNVEAKTNEITTLNDARIKYLKIATETEKLNKLLEESLPLYQDKNVSNDFKKAYEEANKVSVNGESLEQVKEAISKLEKAIAKEKELNKQIEAEASAQLKETIDKAKNALKGNKNEPQKAAEELEKAIAKAEKVLSEGNVEAKTNETTTLNDARIKYLNIATETEKLNKLLEESLPLYQDKNVSNDFKKAYEEANKVSVNGESLEQVKEAISKLEKAIAKEKELNKQIEAEKDKIDKLDLSEKQKEFFKNEIDKAEKTTSVKSVFEKIQKDAKTLIEKITSAKFDFPALEYLTQEEVLKAFDEATTPDEVDKAVEGLKRKNKEIKELNKQIEKQIEVEKDKIDKLDLSEKQKEFFKNKIDKTEKTTSVKSVFEKIQKDAKALVEKITSAKLNLPDLEYLTQEEVLKAFDEATTPDEVDKAVESLKTKNEEIKERIEKIKEKNRIEYTVKTTPEDATVKITELGTNKSIVPVEGKKYILDKEKNYQLSVSKEGYISKNQIIVGSKLNSILKKEVMLTVKKGTLTISNGEGYTFEENKKIIIDKSKLQEKDSKYSVILKVNSNNNDNVLYTLDNNDKATLDAELKGKVSLDSNTGKFEFNKDLEVETIYKAKASAKGYKPLEFEIVIENGTSSTDSPSQDEPQPPKEAQKVKVIFKLQDGAVSKNSEFDKNKGNTIEIESKQGETIKVPKVNYKRGRENNTLLWYEEGKRGIRDFGKGNNVFIKLEKDEASTLTIIGGY